MRQRRLPGSLPLRARCSPGCTRSRSAASSTRHAGSLVPLEEVVDELPARDYDPDIAKALRQAMWRLPAAQRRVVCMKLFEGRSFAEIASVLETTQAAAKMRFTRALRTLRADLERQGIEP